MEKIEHALNKALLFTFKNTIIYFHNLKYITQTSKKLQIFNANLKVSGKLSFQKMVITNLHTHIFSFR